MNNENKSVHEFDFQLICEYFSTIERQGPGSPKMTQKALSFIPNLTENSRIADIGCGTGGQTIVIAQNFPGQITGVDLFPLFIDAFNANAAKQNFQNRVKGLVGDMEGLNFRDEEFDVIWCEGAIYNIGFEKGLQSWRRFLKPGGFIAVTEASWFTEERPSEINDFWMDAYPEIDTIPNKVKQLQNAGYMPVAIFALPESCWTEEFYKPQMEMQENFLKKYAGNSSAQELVAYQRYEVQMYEKYKEFYGYVFYIGKKI
ncbi:MAG: methyltransferase domain-containing protein [Paludibacter sp.]|nr:methyltransferase domain-containing protein [Paludibacter sp.]